MIALIDTNIILDVFLRRELFFQTSYEILKLSFTHNFNYLLPTTSLTDIHYFIKKSTHNAKQSKYYIMQLSNMFTLTSVLPKDIDIALMSLMLDFEDSVISTVALRNNAKFIITRNIKDFKHSYVPAVTPNDFLNYIYGK